MAEHSRTGIIRETGETVEIGPPHPVADVFPMLSQPDLEALAESIKQEGLLEPLLVSANGQHWLIDGRNRLAACQLAGIEQLRVELWDGDDPTELILARNSARRHLNKGQRAILAVQADRLRAQEVRGDPVPNRKLAKAAGLTQDRVLEASAVVNEAPDQARLVLADATSFAEALSEARRRRAERLQHEEEVERLIRDSEEMQDLLAEGMDRKDAAVMLQQQRRDAEAELDRQRQREADERQAIERQVQRLGNFLDGWDTASRLRENPLRGRVLDAMENTDRERFLRIEEAIG